MEGRLACFLIGRDFQRFSCMRKKNQHLTRNWTVFLVTNPHDATLRYRTVRAAARQLASERSALGAGQERGRSVGRVGSAAKVPYITCSHTDSKQSSFGVFCVVRSRLLFSPGFGLCSVKSTCVAVDRILSALALSRRDVAAAIRSSNCPGRR